MISKEEAEKMLGEPIAQTPITNPNLYKDWHEDVSILNFPRLSRRILTEETIFIIHFGFMCDYTPNLLTSDEYLKRKVRYQRFVKEMRAIAPSFVGKKSILAWIPYEIKNDAVRFLSVDRNSLILVPTNSTGVTLIEDILQMREDQFLPKLSQYVKSAHLWGELYDMPEYYRCNGVYGGCVYAIEKECKGLIKTHVDIDLTYSPLFDSQPR